MDVIDEVFDMRNDAAQLQVDESVIEKLQRMHPATLSEYNEGNGPLIWILLIPTTQELMNRFVNGDITEQQLFDSTEPGMNYDAIYLCSASALPEVRGKGFSKKLTIDAINSIRSQHAIKALFTWPFTDDGDALAESIARETKLPLLKRVKQA